MIVALENIRSLWNIGAILRTAEFLELKKCGWWVIPAGNWLGGMSRIIKSGNRFGSRKNLKIKFLRDSLQLIKLAKEKRKSW